MNRIDIDAILQQIANTAIGSLPSIIIGLLGKRDAEERILDPSAILSQSLSMLSGDKLKDLQNQIVQTVLSANVNNWSSSATAQALQQLFTRFLPQLSTMRIE